MMKIAKSWEEWRLKINYNVVMTGLVLNYDESRS